MTRTTDPPGPPRDRARWAALPPLNPRGAVPLCQPEPSPGGAVVSCAACCGIYNFHGHGRELVTGVLELQTTLLSEWDGTEVEAARVVAEIEARRPPVRFGVIYACPFAGFLDPERRRVGCLLHPAQRGEDRRDLCRHGRETCDEAQCTAFTYLSPAEAAAVQAAAGDWYRYGLCVTDLDLVKGLLQLATRQLGARVDAARLAQEPRLTAIFAGLLAHKERWPWARDPARFGKYTFAGERYELYRIDYERLGAQPTAHDALLVALGSVFERRGELEEAIALIDRGVARLVEAYGDRG